MAKNASAAWCHHAGRLIAIPASRRSVACTVMLPFFNIIQKNTTPYLYDIELTASGICVDRHLDTKTFLQQTSLDVTGEALQAPCTLGVRDPSGLR